MLTFAAITVMLDLHTATDLMLSMIKELEDIFPGSVHLRAQTAMVYYHMRGQRNSRNNKDDFTDVRLRDSRKAL
jgi:anaphase-promoting complex subunit 8